MADIKAAGSKRRAPASLREGRVMEPTVDAKAVQQHLHEEREEARKHPSPVWLEKYASLEIEPAQREAVELHLATDCTRCKKAVADFAELGDFFNRLPDPDC